MDTNSEIKFTAQSTGLLPTCSFARQVMKIEKMFKGDEASVSLNLEVSVSIIQMNV